MSTTHKSDEPAASDAQAATALADAPLANETEAEEAGAAAEDLPYRLTVSAPNGASVPVLATAQETIQDIKYVISETPATIEYSCFYLACGGARLADTAELGEIAELQRDSQLDLVEDQYTEREARLHVSRLRSILAGPVTANPDVAGLDAGAPIFSTIKYPDGAAAEVPRSDADDEASKSADASSDVANPGSKRGGKKKRAEDKAPPTGADAAAADPEAGRKAAAADHAFVDFSFAAAPRLDVLSTRKALERLALPHCLRQLVLSGWNPVPRFRQLKGDLLYLLATTIEGQTYHITCARGGFYVNSSTLTRFSAEPYGEVFAGQTGVRSSEFYAAHSLVSLLKRISPKFAQGFAALQSAVSQREPVETLPFVASEQAATPWLVRGSENR
ncbi:Intracellular distribution of mitochondria, partial [Coemansia spiralis]